MDGAHSGRRYEAGDTVKLELVLHHRANLREVRLVFEHSHDKSVAPLIARGRPRPISGRGSDGSMESRLQTEIVIPGQLGHLEDSEDLTDFSRMAFEVVGEPQDTPSVVEIAISDS